MNTSHRRIALLTGASISALGVSSIFAAPAFAAPHDTLADGTYTGIDTSTATLTICEIAADADSVPNSPCFYGVIDTTGGAATVTSSANGQIFQHDSGGAIALTLNNEGSAEVGAIAASSSVTANVFASVSNPILQTAGGVDVSLTINNDGPLLLDAVASANGLFATAHANIHGVGQNITYATTANIEFNNNDDMTVLASANAT